MLSERFPPDVLTPMLTARSEWAPYPTVENCGRWEALPVSVRRFYRERGKTALGFDWPSLPATLFLEFARVGNRSNFEHVNHVRRGTLRDLVLAECIEGEGRFLDDIVNGIWTTCEETYWGYPAHINAQEAGVGLPDVEEPTVDLFAAETVAQLAWTLYLLGDRLDAVSPLVRPRVLYEAKRRVLDPCLSRDDFWWMSFDSGEHGVNNWNPWVNSNWLTAALLLEADPDRRAAAVQKILRSLDVFLSTYAEDGGCDEGPGYWGRAGASLFDCLDLLRSVTGGGLDLFDDSKIGAMGRYIYRAHICDDYYVNFADASAVNKPSASLVCRYGLAIGDADMVSFGAWLSARQSGPLGTQEGSLGRILPALFEMPQANAVPPVPPFPRDVWFEGIQVVVARDRAGTQEGLFVAAKGGHNAESHNHNDVGSFIVYVDGRPVVVDAGVETYRRQTFGPQRYEIWTMQSAFHSLLPTFCQQKEPSAGGPIATMQAPGAEFAARDVVYTRSDDRVQFSLNIAGAYPADAGIESCRRSVTLERGEALTIEDVFELRDAATAITLGLLTPCDVELADGKVVFRATPFGRENGKQTTGSATLTYDASAFEVGVERVEISDARLGGVWGDHLNRVVFTAQAPPLRGLWSWRITS